MIAVLLIVLSNIVRPIYVFVVSRFLINLTTHNKHRTETCTSRDNLVLCRVGKRTRYTSATSIDIKINNRQTNASPVSKLEHELLFDIINNITIPCICRKFAKLSLSAEIQFYYFALVWGGVELTLVHKTSRFVKKPNAICNRDLNVSRENTTRSVFFRAVF